ncbi:hypothetical protein D5086_008628 [Populus alba]|uniref:Uncharacterized protein n=1 Tax=Populus alba TaxID=43335 RepID=A0ACC4CHJ9_POPAL
MAHKGDLVVIGISVGLALGILIASLIFFGIWWYKKRSNLQQCSNESTLPTVPIRMNGLGTSNDFSASLASSVTIRGSEHSQKSSPVSSWWNHHSKDQFASASGILRYSYKDIQKATQKFTTVLGQGSFGPVYKAVMPTGEVLAVKVLASNSKQGGKEFQTEISLLGRLHHRNLVNLLGYCVDKGSHMLIYQFMSNGSLANHLYNDEERFLSWEERLQIALDISHGIEYLHEGAVPPVIHRDLKSANILLDQSMRAKVADFGLSNEEVFDEHTSGLKDRLNPKCSTLVVSFAPSFKAGMSPDGVDEILDKKLVGECNIEEVRDLAAIAHKCLQKFQRKRPSIGEVSQAILKIKQRLLDREMSREFSRVLSRIEDQQVELSRMASRKDGD